jgi:hypothetical protein
MHRSLLEARCRILLARVLLLERQANEALTAVASVPVSDIGLEVRAELHHVRAESYRAVGESDAARRESALAADAVQQLRRSVANPDGLARRASIVSLIRRLSCSVVTSDAFVPSWGRSP